MKKQKVVKLTDLTEEQAIILFGETVYKIVKNNPDIEVTLTAEWDENETN